MSSRRNYITLYYTNTNTEDVTRGEWFISYKRDGDYFTCENDTSSRTMKLNNVEDFIMTWYNNRQYTALGFSEAGRGSISLLIDDKIISESSFTRYQEIRLDTIQSYIRILKDVTEEKYGTPVCPVDKAVGDCELWDQIDEGDKVTDKNVGDYDFM